MDGVSYHGNNVGDQFVNHFKNVLGQSLEVLPFLDPDSLFMKKLPAVEALKLVRIVSNEEIKLALFDIDGNKAPGPDGFSSQFFKDSWSVVGDDVCKVVRDFFSNGKLLKEINATVISLVPKVAAPPKVSDYRPIACCNVVYKIISKVICNRLKGVLGFLVDDNQSAFIPSRQISDNIMLSQELMRNYHRNRGLAKCAFKIDIEKAYDSMEWVFLSSSLKHFGFPKLMVKWIMNCIMTTSFTVNVNGDHTGFFKGMRGLRQGDPLSPYLFTFVIEVFNLVLRREIDKNPAFRYHWQCKELKLTHLCFADDLLLFCNGDSCSVAVLKNVISTFGGLSGLLPNFTKSTVFFGNVREVSRLRILDIMPFCVRSLPVRYLGVLLISKRLYVKDCHLLIDKARKRLLDWKNKSFSFAGRL
nr:RNA-directed DNA polymerase, eukaryota, reverse transcriptase zinc-binding domain protein [Tanacetum cinerariifolium]